MELRLGYAVFDVVVADLREAADTLDESRRRANDDVGALLDGEWTGAAAESFATAWQEWLAGAHEVHAALHSMVASLEITRRELTAADTAVAADAGHLLERLG